MLSQSELSSLYTIISDETKTFENIASNFQKKYKSLDQFKVGVTIWYLIKENLINLIQRLSSFYILYDINRQEQSRRIPFIPLLLESLETSQINLEKKLLIDLLESHFTSSKSTIKQYIEDNKNLEDIKIPNLEQHWKDYNTSKEKCCNEISDWIRPVIYDDNNNASKSPENMGLFDLTSLSPEETAFNYFEPSFLTYYPNGNYPFYDDEPLWILPTLKYEFIWDFTMSPEHETISNLINIHLNEKEKSLSEEQKNYLIEVIGKNAEILKEIHFTPDCFMKLIEKDYELATDIFLKICNHGGIEDYLSIILKNKWSVNSMKVMNQIIQKVDMPNEFIEAYLRHLIKNYREETTKEDKSRVAKLIAFFITNLLSHEHISHKMVPPEIKELYVEKGAEIEDMIKEMGKNSS